MGKPIIDHLEKVFNLIYGWLPRTLDESAADSLLVGHRGVFEHPTLVENTFPAFDFAISHGGGIEFDLHLTRDLVLVVHHDPTLERIHGISRTIRDLTLAELMELAPSVPTLDELFERYGHRCPHYFMEPKVEDEPAMGQLVEAVSASLDQACLGSRVTMISSDARMLDRLRGQLPGVPRAFIFMFFNKEAVEYVQRHRDTGLAGWYFGFPEVMRPFLEEHDLFQGVGQIDYLNTYHHYRNRGFQVQFTNRIDRLVARPSTGTPIMMPSYASPLGVS